VSLPLVILTASIDPRGCHFLRRADPAQRLADYVGALKLWLATGAPLLLVENSGHPLGELAELAAANLVQLELLQFTGNDYPRHLGKGFGEMGILRHALRHSASIRRHRRVSKVTGRLYVENFAEIAAADGSLCQAGGRTECFICERAFLHELTARMGDVNDSQGRYFEHAFSAARRHYDFRLMRPEPLLRGYSGTFNRLYQAGL
jgi:hypothetical protein